MDSKVVKYHSVPLTTFQLRPVFFVSFGDIKEAAWETLVHGLPLPLHTAPSLPLLHHPFLLFTSFLCNLFLSLVLLPTSLFPLPLLLTPPFLLPPPYGFSSVFFLFFFSFILSSSSFRSFLLFPFHAYFSLLLPPPSCSKQSLNNPSQKQHDRRIILTDPPATPHATDRSGRRCTAPSCLLQI